MIRVAMMAAAAIIFRSAIFRRENWLCRYRLCPNASSKLFNARRTGTVTVTYVNIYEIVHKSTNGENAE